MNQAFLADILRPHLQVVVFGDVKLDSTGLHFMNPEYELVSEDLSSLKTSRVVPFYEKTGTVTPNMQRRIVKDMLQEWDRKQPGRLDNMLRALGNVVPSHLADRALFDFATLAAEGMPRADGDIAFDEESPQTGVLITESQS